MDQPTVKQQWDRFLEMVVPKEASQGQVQDTQSAFYAGAAAMMGMLGQISDNAASEDEACVFMSGIDRELKTFVVEMAANAMASAIGQSLGAEVRVQVHDVTKPPAGEVH